MRDQATGTRSWSMPVRPHACQSLRRMTVRASVVVCALPYVKRRIDAVRHENLLSAQALQANGVISPIPYRLRKVTGSLPCHSKRIV